MRRAARCYGARREDDQAEPIRPVSWCQVKTLIVVKKNLSVIGIRYKEVTHVLSKGRTRRVTYAYVCVKHGAWSGWLHVPCNVAKALEKPNSRRNVESKRRKRVYPSGPGCFPDHVL